MTDQTLVPVPVGACRCPGAPHGDGDVVYLYPELGMQAGLAIMAAVDLGQTNEETLAAIYRLMVERGVADWTFLDDEGEKVEISPSTISGALPWMKGGNLVAKAAIAQYAGLLAPLATPDPAKTTTRKPKSSQPGQTGVTSISRKRAG